MRETTRRRLLAGLLVASVLLVGWLVARAAQGGPDGAGSSPDRARTSVTATSGGEATQRHTASREPSNSATDPESGLQWVDESALPREAHDTLALIASGGPFPYPRNDAQTFQNREGLLPERPRGYYREYTVETPGADDRGPRRIVTGQRGEKYWTDDHYDSFKRIREGT